MNTHMHSVYMADGEDGENANELDNIEVRKRRRRKERSVESRWRDEGEQQRGRSALLTLQGFIK